MHPQTQIFFCLSDLRFNDPLNTIWVVVLGGTWAALGRLGRRLSPHGGAVLAGGAQDATPWLILTRLAWKELSHF